MRNIEREELARILNLHIDTLEDWELRNVLPKPENIKKLCEFFNLPLHYFHEFYGTYFNDPGTRIRSWKNKNNYTYPDVMKLLDISHSGLARLMNGKINLSYYMYVKLKNLGAF